MNSYSGRLVGDGMNITVIAESTPGPIAINCATFVGYKKKGILGAIASTVGVVLSSFLIICLIAFALDNFLEITIVGYKKISKKNMSPITLICISAVVGIVG